MFSAAYYREIKNAFDSQMALLDERYSELQRNKAQNEANENESCMSELSGRLLSGKKEEISAALARCTEDEAQALTFIYSAMPLSDLLDYPASLFLAYAKHGVFLWNHGAFAGRVPEKLFANYVLHYRVNNEDIDDTRGFFYDRVKEAVDLEEASSRTMYDTAIDVNYWCAREATYRSTDRRTQNPRTMFGTTTGRCGEESTFAVTALRSIGIPARQIYAPLWSHCDDNHAWVELWCDGKWYFLGACEPEEEMNRGWFTGPAFRSVMLHSRWFGKDAPEDRQVGPRGMAKVLNHMEHYARTVELAVKVEDENGNPVPNAKVDFQVLNHGAFGSVAVVYTGSEGEDCGVARLLTGFGDLYISASADICSDAESDLTDGVISGKKISGRKLYGETMVSLGSFESNAEETYIVPGTLESNKITVSSGTLECDKTTVSSGTLENDRKTVFSVDISENGKENEALSGRLTKEKVVECKVILREKPECWEGWKEIDIHAPKPGDMYDGLLTAEQLETGEKRLAQAAEYRREKAESFYDEREAERALNRFDGEEREKVKEILHKAHSNMGEIVRFLEWDADCFLPVDFRAQSDVQEGNHIKSNKLESHRMSSFCLKNGKDNWKLKVLNTLREKDYWDIKAEVLMDCCINAFSCAGGVPEEIFYGFLLCPRVSIEMLHPCRMALKKYWDEYAEDSEKEALKQNPGCLPEIVNKWVISMPEQEYENLITSPLGCLRGGVGSRHSKEVLCVNLYRALGIPARLNYFDGAVEYFECGAKDMSCTGSGEVVPGKADYQGGKFISCNGEEKSCTLILCEDGSLKLSDWEHYSMERFEEDGFRRMGLWGQLFHMEGSELELQVAPGIYRIVTTNRKRDGGQLAKMTVFKLQKGESRRMTVSMREMSVEDMLTHIKVEDFSLKTMEGRDGGTLSGLTNGGKALFLWLGVTREPTEHILNELYDRQKEFAALKTPVYAILKAPEDLENTTLHRTLEALPEIDTLLDDFGENYCKLAQTLDQEIGKLPLAVILNGQQECIYSDAGYNVGLADMLYKILV